MNSEHFTPHLLKVLALSQEEAAHFHRHHVGSEQLLLGLLRDDEGVAATVLHNLGVDLERVRTCVEFIVGAADSPSTRAVILRPRAEKVIELAVEEMLLMGRRKVDTEHLLLGILREGDGVAAAVLDAFGITVESVRAETMSILQGSDPAAPLVEEQQAAPADDAARAFPIGRSHAPPLRWSYLDVQVGYRDHEGGRFVTSVNGAEHERFGRNITPIGVALELLGAAGWELVAIDNPSGDEAHYILKRLHPASLAF